MNDSFLNIASITFVILCAIVFVPMILFSIAAAIFHPNKTIDKIAERFEKFCGGRE